MSAPVGTGPARILVLDGHSPAALAFTRSLGRAGHWIAVGSNTGIGAPAEVSRYCKLSFRYPVPSEDAAGFIDAVLDFVRQNAIELIVPATDWTVAPLSRNREKFAGVSQLALGPDSALEFAADKFRTVELARELGIAVPETALVRSVSDLKEAVRSFPVVVKDRFSARWEGNRAVLGSVAYAYSAEDLKEKVERRLRAAGDVLVQQFVFGSGVGYSCMVAGDGIYAPFMWLRIRETDPRGSGSSARKSIPLAPAISGPSAELLKRIGLQGIGMVEFKQPPSGPPVLMEINARPWGSMQLAISSGVDYPNYLAGWMLTGELPGKKIDYKTGVVCRRMVSELTHLEHVYHGKPAGWPGDYPKLLPTMIKIAAPWYPGMCYDDVWLSDLRPGLAGLSQWFRSRSGR